MQFSGPKFEGILEMFSFTSQFLWLKMQKSTFLKKNVLSGILCAGDIKLVSLSKKTHQTFEIVCTADFLSHFVISSTHKNQFMCLVLSENGTCT